MKRICILVWILAFGGCCATGAQSPTSPWLSGTLLGETQSKVLFAMGSPDLVYLAGRESESGQPSPHDRIILKYFDEVDLGDATSQAAIRVFLAPNTHLVEAITIDLVTNKETEEPAPVSSSTVSRVFGNQFREVRQTIVFDEDGFEGVPEPCHDEEGEMLSWIFEDQGLQVYFEDSADGVRTASSLRFASAILNGEETIEPCD